jgi:hypothetical protein
MAGPGLAGAAVGAAVVGDGPEPVVCDEHGLVVPGIGVQRPPRAPVLVEDLRAIAGGDGAIKLLPVVYGVGRLMWK